MIAAQKEIAKRSISDKVIHSLDQEICDKLDQLLIPNKDRTSPLNFLKQPAGRPSHVSMLKLTEKIEMILETGVFEIDLRWLNNNLQRFLSRYTKNCEAYKMRALEPKRRYTALISFLLQTY